MRTVVLLPILLLSLSSFSQKSPKLLEAELKKQFEKIRSLDENPTINDTINTYDSMQRVNDFILDQIVKQGNNNTALLNYAFTSLNQYIDVTTSKDKSFRVYSWDTYAGGSMHFYYAVAQYLGNDNKVYTQSLVDNSEGDPGLWYSKIYTFNNKGKKYYFCIGHGKYSSMELAQEVTVYTIKGNRLVQAPIIRTQTRITNFIQVSYHIPTVDDKNDQSIVFDEFRNELKIPLVDEKGKMSNKNIIYKFSGTHFERVGIR